MLEVQHSPLLNSYIEAQNSASNNVVDKKDKKLEELEKRYKEYTDKQGIFNDRNSTSNTLAAFNMSKLVLGDDIIKNINSKNAIELYKEGKISYEAALKTINRLEKTNEICVNVSGNILVGFLATTAGLLAKSKLKASTPQVALLGVVIGAAVKPLFNIVDRALNNIKGDELDSKKILKDAASGGLNGFISGINAGFGKDFTSNTVVRKISFEFLKQAGLFIWQKITHSDKSEA